MKIKLTLLLLLLTSFVFSNENIKKAAFATSQKIIAAEKQKHSCILSPKEQYDASAFYFQINKITLETFADTVKTMDKLIAALRLVVEKKEQPDLVYSKLELSKYKITEDNWRYYLKNYQTPERISKLEEMTPNNMDVIIKSGASSFAPSIERWLLNQYILYDFDMRYPQNKSFSAKQKMSAWWQETLKEYKINDDEKKLVLAILLFNAGVPRQNEEQWKLYFKERIARFAESKR